MLAGHGQLFLLEGEPGIGKTCLAENFAREAAASAVRLLWTWCPENPQAPALWPWLQLVRDYLHPDHSAKVHDQSQKCGALQRKRNVDAVSELDELFRPPSDAAQIDFRLFNSIANVFKEAARKAPLILILDAFGAADGASLRMLHFLACQLRECRIMVVAAYRMGAFRLSASSGILGELISHGCWIPLRGLTEVQVRALVGKLVGSPPEDRTVAAIHEASGGNPLIVNNLMRLILAEHACKTLGPQCGGALSWNGLRLVTQTHLAPLSASTRELLNVAAAIGREFDLADLKRASRHWSSRIFDALEEARSVGLVTELEGMSERRYRFTHGLVRDALCKELPATIRMRLDRLLSNRPGDHSASSGAHCKASSGFENPDRGDAQKQTVGQSGAVTTVELTGLRSDAGGRPLVSGSRESAVRNHGLVVNGADNSLRPSGDYASNSSSPKLPITASARDDTGRNIFRREGDYWTLCFGNSLFRLRHSKGLALMAHLLGHPNQEFHVFDLGATVDRRPTLFGQRSLVTNRSDPTETSVASGDLGPLLDASAKASYRRRLRELADELDESRSLNDLGRIDRNEEEITELNRELARAVGLDGRDRKAGSEVERSRVRITNAIRGCLEKIGKNHPEMRRYLSGSIRTGAICRYTPGADFPGWQL